MTCMGDGHDMHGDGHAQYSTALWLLWEASSNGASAVNKNILCRGKYQSELNNFIILLTYILYNKFLLL